MKKIMLIVQLLALPVVAAYCQQSYPVTAKQSGIVSRQLEICYRKTTNLIFPSAIKSVDRGSGDILAQKPDGVENVLKVKAGKEYFPETNLTVITADGQFYSFTVVFANNPASLIVQTGYVSDSCTAKPGSAIFGNTANNEDLVAGLAAQASVTRRNIRNVHDKTAEMEASIRGLYTADGMFFYKLILNNSSNIDYEIAAIRFFIEDKKRVKRSASQQVILQPISVIGGDGPVPAHGERMVIITLAKQTLVKGKHLIVEVDEKNGGRNLLCILDNKVLLKAKPITKR